MEMRAASRTKADKQRDFQSADNAVQWVIIMDDDNLLCAQRYGVAKKALNVNFIEP